MNFENHQPENTMQGFWDSYYPEIYQILYPKVSEAIEEAQQAGIALTPDTIDTVIEQILQDLDFADEEPNAPVYSEDATPVFNGYGYGRHGRGRGRRYPYYDRRPARDLLRILFLRDLFGGGRRCRDRNCW